MKYSSYRDTPAHASGGCTTAAERWKMFENRCDLEKSTKVSLEIQVQLERIGLDDLQLILQQYFEGTHFSHICGYIKCFYGIEIDGNALARYWRRTLPGFVETEEQRREYRTAERALKNLAQEENIK